MLVFASHSMSSWWTCATPGSGWTTARQAPRPVARRAQPLQGAGRLRRAERAPVMPEKAPPDSVVAVVVTRYRSDLLVDSLAAMAKQTHPIAHLVVRGQRPGPAGPRVVEACGLPVTYLPSWHNLGGGGRVRAGHVARTRVGADWYGWVTTTGGPPDEARAGHPAGHRARRELAVVSPVVADQADPDTLAFPLRRGCAGTGPRRLGGRGTAAGHRLLLQTARCSGPALWTWWASPTCGCSSGGDEVEMHAGWCAPGLPFGPVCARYTMHPTARRVQADAGRSAACPGPGGPDQALLHLRNRGYLFGTARMRLIGALELVRSAGTFLVSKRDPAAFELAAAGQAGRASGFHPPPEPPPGGYRRGTFWTAQRSPMFGS